MSRLTEYEQWQAELARGPQRVGWGSVAGVTLWVATWGVTAVACAVYGHSLAYGVGVVVLGALATVLGSKVMR